MPDDLIYIIAGEESGDVLGSRLMAAIKDRGYTHIMGIGGQGMSDQGLNSLFPMTDLSVMGVFEIVPRLPQLLGRIRETADDIIAKQPRIVVTIDSPDFCKRVVKKARPYCPNTKFIHYVAPTVWAWRPARAKTMAKIFDGLICLLPFEPSYFEKEGLRTAFCGHPVVETIDPKIVQRDPNMLLILPGSRVGEIHRHAPIFARAYERLKEKNPDLQAKIVALPHIKSIIEDHFNGLDVAYIDPKTRYDAFKKAGFAIATSGTVGLELAVAGCPHLVAYKMNSLTWWLLKQLVKVKYAHLVNIMADEDVIPECLQVNCTADSIVEKVQEGSVLDLSWVRENLAGYDPKMTPSQQAADFALSFIVEA